MESKFRAIENARIRLEEIEDELQYNQRTLNKETLENQREHKRLHQCSERAKEDWRG